MSRLSQALGDRLAFVFRAYLPLLVASAVATVIAYYYVDDIAFSFYEGSKVPSDKQLHPEAVAGWLYFVSVAVLQIPAWWLTDLLLTNRCTHNRIFSVQSDEEFVGTTATMVSPLLPGLLTAISGASSGGDIEADYWMVIAVVTLISQVIVLSGVLLFGQVYDIFARTVLRDIYQDRKTRREARFQRDQQRKARREQRRLQCEQRRRERQRRSELERRRRKQVSEQKKENTETPLQRNLRRLKADCEERVEAVKELGLPEDQAKALIDDIVDDRKRRMTDAVVESENDDWQVRGA